MVHSKSAKLELDQTNPIQFFDINSEKYGCKIHCTAKASGKVGVNYFSAKFKFVVNTKKIPRITDIHVNDVTHIGKSNVPFKKCGKYHYYYEINCSDSSSESSSSSVIDDEFELQVYDAIKTMLINASVVKVGYYARVTLTLPSDFDSMCIKIRFGTDKYTHSGSSCNDCSLSAAPCSSSSSSSCSKSSSSSCSSSSSSSSSSRCNSFMQKIIKLIAWSAVISFIVYVLKNKFCIGGFNLNLQKQSQIEYKSELILDSQKNEVDIIDDVQIE